MVGFRLSLCQAVPPTRNADRIGKRTGVRFSLFRVPRLAELCGSGFSAAGWPLAFLTGQDLRVSMPTLLEKYSYRNESAWGCSAVGSAREWHSRGRRFNPGQLHQTALRVTRRLFRGLS